MQEPECKLSEPSVWEHPPDWQGVPSTLCKCTLFRSHSPSCGLPMPTAQLDKLKTHRDDVFLTSPVMVVWDIYHLISDASWHAVCGHRKVVIFPCTTASVICAQTRPWPWIVFTEVILAAWDTWSLKRILLLVSIALAPKEGGYYLETFIMCHEKHKVSLCFWCRVAGWFQHGCQCYVVTSC